MIVIRTQGGKVAHVSRWNLLPRAGGLTHRASVRIHLLCGRRRRSHGWWWEGGKEKGKLVRKKTIFRYSIRAGSTTFGGLEMCSSIGCSAAGSLAGSDRRPNLHHATVFPAGSGAAAPLAREKGEKYTMRRGKSPSSTRDFQVHQSCV